jgi:hypothetical protein
VENKADSASRVSRRSFLWGTGVTVTGLMTSVFPIRAFAQQSSANGQKAQVVGRRKLGSLEVSSVPPPLTEYPYEVPDFRQACCPFPASKLLRSRANQIHLQIRSFYVER